MAGPQWIVGKPDNGDGSCPGQQVANRVRLGLRCHADILAQLGTRPSCYLLAVSLFCLNCRSASLRMVSETSLFPDRFLRSAVSRFFISPRPTSNGVRGL